jgi:formate dehydrogenase major subunit
LVRRNGELKAATWEDALDVVTAKLRSLSGSNGNGVAAMSSTRLPTEALYIFKQLFAEKMGSDMVTSIEEGVPTALPGQVARKMDRPFEGSLEDIETADCVIAIGVDLIANHQVAGFFVKRALPMGTRLVVIDPFDNGLHELAHFSLRPKKGSDYDLLLGLMEAVTSQGLAKQKAGADYDLAKHTPDVASQKTGIPAETIRQAAGLIGSAQNPAFIYGKGITRGENPTVLEALLELARMIGALDEDHSGVIGTKGQANSMTAGLYELDKTFEAKGQQAVYLALGDDHASQRLIERTVQASYVSPVTEMADVVLPVETWAEQEGHFLNLEGRLQEANRALTPPQEVRSHVDVFRAIADGVGVKLDEDWRQALKRRVPTNKIIDDLQQRV